MTEKQTNDSGPAETLQILRTQSLTTVVFQELERRIMEGELLSGERINEKQLAEEQGVSRGPIREACRRLEEAGLVEIKVNRGVFVRELKFIDLLEIYDIRAALFGFAGRVLARVVSMEQTEQLENLVERMRTYADEGNLEEYYPLNLEFHATLMAFTNNKRLAKLYDGMNKELNLFRRQALVAGKNISVSCDEHQDIVNALRGGNPSKIASAMRMHSLAGRNRLMRVVPSDEAKGFVGAWDED